MSVQPITLFTYERSKLNSTNFYFTITLGNGFWGSSVSSTRLSLWNSQEKPQRDSKKRLQHRCFPVNFKKCLRTLFLQNNSWRLLLNPISYIFRFARKVWFYQKAITITCPVLRTFNVVYWTFIL